MHTHHKKNWIIATLGALMVLGGASSYTASGSPFFRGTLSGELLKSSVIDSAINSTETGGIAQSEAYDFSAITRANAKRLATEKQRQGEERPRPAAKPAVIEQAAPVITKKLSPCPAESSPILKDGEVAGCTSTRSETLPGSSTKAARQTRPAPTPVISFPETLPTPTTKPSVRPTSKLNGSEPASCEEQGLVRYTGPDQGELLHGMCISLH